jgi:hypothetical protein
MELGSCCIADLEGVYYQANYINALAVSVSPFFEPAKGILGGFFFPLWVDFFMTLGELLKFVR